MAPPKPDQPALIPENVLKRKNDLDALHRKQLALEEVRGTAFSKRRGTKPKGSVTIIKPETILAKARNRRNHIRRVKRVQKHGMLKRAVNKAVFATKVVVNDITKDETTVSYQANSFGAKMVFCIRIRNNDCIPKSIKRILDMNGLRNLHDGVFLKYDDEMRRQLHLAEPWIVYGRPTATAVKELLERRGHAKIKGERIPLSDNTVVEGALQQHGLLCVDDLVHALTTTTTTVVDDNDEDATFGIVTKFLWPFRLADSKTRFERTVLKLKDGKDYGDKGDAIQEYIAQVL